MRRDPDGRFVHVALAAEALFLSVCVGPVMKRRTSRGGGDRGYLWSPHGAKADLIGEMGRLDAKERMRERERESKRMGHPVGERKGGWEARRCVAWKVAASELEDFCMPGRQEVAV